VHAVAALLLLASVHLAVADVVTVTMNDGTVLRGSVLECSDTQARFAPQSGGHELLLDRTAVREMRAANGDSVCWANRPESSSRWGTGILSFLVIPAASTLIGGFVGDAFCKSYDKAVCQFFGSITGLATGFAVGATVFVLSGRDEAPPPRAVADPARPQARKTALSLTLHF
jgi:hypothetical protein